MCTIQFCLKNFTISLWWRQRRCSLFSMVTTLWPWYHCSWKSIVLAFNSWQWKRQAIILTKYAWQWKYCDTDLVAMAINIGLNLAFTATSLLKLWHCNHNITRKCNDLDLVSVVMENTVLLQWPCIMVQWVNCDLDIASMAMTRLCFCSSVWKRRSAQA